MSNCLVIIKTTLGRFHVVDLNEPGTEYILIRGMPTVVAGFELGTGAEVFGHYYKPAQRALDSWLSVETHTLDAEVI